MKKPLFSTKAIDYAASSFFRITKRLIEESFVDSTQHLNIIGDVVNLVPIYWITGEIVSSSPRYHLQATEDMREGGSIHQISEKSIWGCRREGRV